MLHKPQHDRHKWNNYSYEIYNKLELDIDNINKDKIEKIKLLKPLDFALAFIDSTSEKEPFLPVYLIETLSDYYHQKNRCVPGKLLRQPLPMVLIIKVLCGSWAALTKT